MGRIHALPKWCAEEAESAERYEAVGSVGQWDGKLESVILTRRRGGAEEDAEKCTDKVGKGRIHALPKWRAEEAESAEKYEAAG